MSALGNAAVDRLLELLWEAGRDPERIELAAVDYAALLGSPPADRPMIYRGVLAVARPDRSRIVVRERDGGRLGYPLPHAIAPCASAATPEVTP